MMSTVNERMPANELTVGPCVLAFDGCLRSLAVTVLSRDGRMVTRRESAEAGGQAERLMPLIEATLLDAGVAWSEIDRIAVTLGPGGFTSVRVGVAAARALALALAKPAVGMSTLQLLAVSALDDLAATAQRIVVVIPAGKGGVYRQAFDRNGVALGSADVVEAPDLAMIVQPDDVLAGPGVPVVLQACEGRPLLASTTLEALEPSTVRLAACGRHLTLGAELRPVYLRAADAKPQSGNGLVRA